MANGSALAGFKRMPALTRLMLFAARLPLDRTPQDAGLDYEDVSFPARDGVGLRGWFVPAAGDTPAPAVVFVHGWLWNRLGNRAGRVPFTDRDVDFLPATRALHHAGFHVLLFDLRNHGESDTARPVTYGPRESRDFAGAVDYLRGRADVDSERIGTVACSMGAVTAMYGIPTCQPVRAALLVQPASLRTFNRNFARTELGPLGPLATEPIDVVYFFMRAPGPRKQAPLEMARRLDGTVARYVQGTGDPWGTMEDVEAMAAATPNALPVVAFPSEERYSGYRYIETQPDDVAEFFREHL